MDFNVFRFLRTPCDRRAVSINALELIAVLLLILPTSQGAGAATSFNAQSAMGVNLAAVNFTQANNRSSTAL